MTQRISGWQSLLSLPAIYDFCQNLVGSSRYYQEIVNKYIKPNKNMRILDLGCGPATILAYLPAEIDYVGVDLSRKYIDAARSVYGKRARFYCLRVEDMNSAGLTGFDLVMGLGVLHHLDEYQARQFFIAARKALKEKGRCLLADPCLVPGQHPVARFLIRIDRGQNVRSARGYAVLAESAFCCLSQEISHDKLRIPYTHHIMQCWKTTP